MKRSESLQIPPIAKEETKDVLPPHPTVEPEENVPMCDIDEALPSDRPAGRVRTFWLSRDLNMLGRKIKDMNKLIDELTFQIDQRARYAAGLP